MKLHELKLLEEYATAKKDGIKLFEIRKDDRNFQVGDLVKYNIVEKDFETNEIKASCNSELCEYFDNRVFNIKYISDYEQKNGYVVFSEEAYYIGDQKMNNFSWWFRKYRWLIKENNMDSEKVKEIKKALECCIKNETENTCEYCKDCPMFYEEGIERCDIDLWQKTLTLINELESENERLMKLQARGGCRVAELGIENQELKDRIAELESELEKEQINNLNCDTELQYKEKRIALLEKENETLRNAKVVYENVDYCYEDLKKAEKRIAELEKEIKENAFYAKGYAQGIKNTYEVVIPDKLKQFAERLKSKDCSVPLHKGFILIEDHAIDETLKEFIKE